MTSFDTLAGSLRVRPGAPRPHNLVSTRSDQVSRLTRGRLAVDLPGTLGSLFSLCGHAHRVCASLALEAVSGSCATRRGPVPEALRLETLREHLRRICLDWPRQLANDEMVISDAALAVPAAVLASCPLFRLGPAAGQNAGQGTGNRAGRDAAFQSAPTAGLTRWVEANLLEMAAGVWLAAWRREPRECLRSWSEQAPTAVARLLAGCREVADRPEPAGRALRVQADDAGLRALAASLLGEPGFALAPYWSAPDAASTLADFVAFGGRAGERQVSQRSCPSPQPSPQRGEGAERADGFGAETGPWARLHTSSHAVCDTPWLRLGARLAELLSLAAEAGHEHAAPLMSGCVATGPGEGLGWVEMARGLLVHAVRLDGQGAAARVDACRVLAPTEWNFHPSGPVARALEAMPPPGRGASGAAMRQSLRVLIAAYDPCVPYAIETQGETHGETHGESRDGTESNAPSQTRPEAHLPPPSGRHPNPRPNLPPIARQDASARTSPEKNHA